MPDGQETRIVDPTTGAAKGSKLARFDLVPWTILREVAEHFGRGARKYEDRNWEKGYKWSLSFAALHRHLEAFWSGEEYDNDPSLYLDHEAHTARHIIAVVWHALVLAYYSRYRIGTDDRPRFSLTDMQHPARHVVDHTSCDKGASAEADHMLHEVTQRPVEFGGVQIPEIRGETPPEARTWSPGARR